MIGCLTGLIWITCRHIDERKLYTRGMEALSPCVERYEFVDVFLLPFLSNRKQSVQSALSNRRQEASSEESCSPMAKHRFTNLVMAKPKNCFIGAAK